MHKFAINFTMHFKSMSSMMTLIIIIIMSHYIRCELYYYIEHFPNPVVHPHKPWGGIILIAIPWMNRVSRACVCACPPTTLNHNPDWLTSNKSDNITGGGGRHRKQWNPFNDVPIKYSPQCQHYKQWIPCRLQLLITTLGGHISRCGDV